MTEISNIFRCHCKNLGASSETSRWHVQKQMNYLNHGDHPLRTFCILKIMFVQKQLDWITRENKQTNKQEKFQITKVLAHKVPEPLVTGTVFWGDDTSLGTEDNNQLSGYWAGWPGTAIFIGMSQHISAIHQKGFFCQHWVYAHKFNSFDKSTSTSENSPQKK